MIKIYTLLVFTILVFFCLSIDARKSKASGGTYRYVNNNSGRTHYVGATNNFNRRHKEHVRQGDYYTGNRYKLKKNYMSTSNKQHMAETERRHIKKYNPIANRNRGGGGL